MFKKPANLLYLSLIAVALPLSATESPTILNIQESPSTPQKNQIQESVTPPSTPFQPFTGAISGAKVRLRAYPSLEAHVVRETNKGEMFVVIGETSEYFAVSPPKGTKGYIFRTFILDGVIEGERVNVRLFPDMEAPVVAQLNRGDRVETAVCQANNKWLELDVPAHSRFFIAKEYVERIGGPELAVAFEKKKIEGAHLLSAASLLAQAEMQKPFEQIDFDRIQSTFNKIHKEFADLPSILEEAKSTSQLIQEIYIQKKIAFLEGKSSSRNGLESQQWNQLAQITAKPTNELGMQDLAASTLHNIGLATTLNEDILTDKMVAWQPVEESLYHVWVASEGEKSFEEFYLEEMSGATMLSGIIETYNRPVKNRPGDFILKSDHVPIAFLYSTKINLEKLVGQKVTVMATPRPNHNFAFPAYFVLNIE